MRSDWVMLRAAWALVVVAGAAVAAPTPPAREPSGGPSLDELLGLEDPGEGGADAPADASLDPDRAELDRQLGAQEMGERLDQAAALMDEIARRMRATSDVSITTQRQQERVIGLLDEVIDAAQRQQQQQGQPSSQQQQQGQQQQQQPSQPQAQRQQGQEPGQQAAQETHMPGGGEGVQLRAGQAAAGAAWGALPDRLRDALTQGLSDRYSSLYERATESYYRRLAEEESR